MCLHKNRSNSSLLHVFWSQLLTYSRKHTCKSMGFCNSSLAISLFYSLSQESPRPSKHPHPSRRWVLHERAANASLARSLTNLITGCYEKQHHTTLQQNKSTAYTFTTCAPLVACTCKQQTCVPTSPSSSPLAFARLSACSRLNKHFRRTWLGDLALILSLSSQLLCYVDSMLANLS